MKRALLILTCTSLIFASSLYASYGQVFSDVLGRNAVGYQTVTIPRGSFVLAGLPFDSLSGVDRTAEQLLGDQLPFGSVVYKWDHVEQRYGADNNSIAGWSSTLTFARGEAFWIYVPLTAPDEDYLVYLMGEVPSDAFTSVCLSKGINMTSYPYPAEQVWGQTAFAASGAVGDMVILWAGSHYVINNRTVFGWSDPNMLLPVGNGFWYMAKETDCYEIAKPYVWP